MTREQIFWGLGINLFALVLGAILSPLFKRAWNAIRTPGPLSPRDRGKLVEYIGTMEYELNRTEHFIQHPKDLYLLLFRLTMITLASFTLAFTIYVSEPSFLGPFVKREVVALLFVPLFVSLLSIYIAYRFSDENIHTYRDAVRRRIEEARAKLG
jgi:multisubunit Na+/H+ antiporter MnhG subunit